jgi:hypothetical protein
MSHETIDGLGVCRARYCRDGALRDLVMFSADRLRTDMRRDGDDTEERVGDHFALSKRGK